jgi:hypothetical protein
MVRIVEEFNRAVDVSPQQQALNVRRLRLSTQDDAAAIVDVDAFAVAHVSTRLGASSVDFRFRGPFSLRRDGTTWRIDGYAVDQIPFPQGFYDPLVEVTEDGIDVTIGAQLTKKGTLVGVEIVNGADREVVVSDFAISFSPLRLFTARWGSLHVPATVAAGARWADVVQWSGLSVFRRITAIIQFDGVERRYVLEPPRGVGPRRRRLRPLYGAEGLFYAFLALGAISSAATGTVGLLGIGLIGPGTYGVARGARTFLAGFWSSWPAFLALVGLTELVTGVVLMLRTGFGWIGTFAVVASIVFALGQTVTQGRTIREERRRHVHVMREG